MGGGRRPAALQGWGAFSGAPSRLTALPLILPEGVLNEVTSRGPMPLHPGASATGRGWPHKSKETGSTQPLGPRRWPESLLRNEKQPDSIVSISGKHQKHNQEPQENRSHAEADGAKSKGQKSSGRPVQRSESSEKIITASS